MFVPSVLLDLPPEVTAKSSEAGQRTVLFTGTTATAGQTVRIMPAVNSALWQHRFGNTALCWLQTDTDFLYCAEACPAMLILWDAIP
jgi:hypothetical protein